MFTSKPLPINTLIVSRWRWVPSRSCSHTNLFAIRLATKPLAPPYYPAHVACTLQCDIFMDTHNRRTLPIHARLTTSSEADCSGCAFKTMDYGFGRRDVLPCPLCRSAFYSDLLFSWSKLCTRRTVEIQRKATFAGPPIQRYRWRVGTTAVPSRAESRRSSALGHFLPWQ